MEIVILNKYNMAAGMVGLGHCSEMHKILLDERIFFFFFLLFGFVADIFILPFAE